MGGRLVAKAARILISGGGIGGLTAALALLRRGFDVEVYEQSSQVEGVGAGISISQNGLRVLDAVGLAAQLSRVEVAAPRRQIRHWKTGDTWDWFKIQGAGSRY